MKMLWKQKGNKAGLITGILITLGGGDQDMVTFFKESAVSPAEQVAKYASVLFSESEISLLGILIGQN